MFCGRSKANTVNCVVLVTTIDQSLMLLKIPGNYIIIDLSDFLMSSNIINC